MRKALYGLAGAVGLVAALFGATGKVGSEEPKRRMSAFRQQPTKSPFRSRQFARY
jgi:hypothetical protein